MFDVPSFQKKRRSRFGQDFYYFETVDSTNIVAEKLAREGSAEGTVILSDSQTGGRGRKGRSWYSPPDTNLYFSIILHPQQTWLPFLPFVSGLSVLRVLRLLNLSPDLKWPNDVLVGERKISGILIQTSSEENRLLFAIVGCGINVNQREFPEELLEKATSIALETGEEVSRESVLASFLLEFERLYQTLDTLRWDEFCQEIENNSSFVYNCHVRITTEDRSYEGVTRGLDSYGGLILEMSCGERKIFYAGEIEACRKKG